MIFGANIMSDWQKCTPDTLAKAKALYEFMMEISDSPSEAAEIMSSMYVNLWLVGRAPNSNLEEMLSGLCDCIRLNVAQAGSTMQ